MKVKREKFGVLNNGEKVYLYTVSNGEMSFSAMNLGCTITDITVPSKNGKKDNVVLGFSDLSGYVYGKGAYFGAVVGRFANRIGKASFSLNGKQYQLDKNDNGNCLHGGFIGYDKMLYESHVIENDGECGVCFTRKSFDGEQGFPGTLSISISYILTMKNEIQINYTCSTDKDTPVNLTNHTYFNLTGNPYKTIFNHELEINAAAYTESDAQLIPTGKIIKVDDDKPFDFRTKKAIGKDFSKVAGGYDHNFVLDSNDSRKYKGLKFCAEAYEPESERSVTVWTDCPGVQFYSGNSLTGTKGRLGQVHEPNQGFCLETQFFPDSPNQPSFPSCIVHVGETFNSKTIFAFNW